MLLEEQDQDIQIFFRFVKCHSSRGNFQSPHLTLSKSHSLYNGPRALHKRYSITSLASSLLHRLSSLCSSRATFLCCSSSQQAHFCLGALCLQFAVWVMFSVPERLLGTCPATGDSLIVTTAVRSFLDTLKMKFSLSATVLFLPRYFSILNKVIQHTIFFTICFL